MRHLFTTVAIGLSTLSAAAELPPEEWFSSCDELTATCLSPQIDRGNAPIVVAEPPKPHGSPCERPVTPTGEPRPIDAQVFYQPLLTPIADDAPEFLRRWSLASQAHLSVTEAERLRLRYDAPERSGQELSLICELQGPIDDVELARRYDWSVTDDRDAVELTATPKDDLERLFYERFTVTLDATTWRPASLRFGFSANRERSAVLVVALRPWVDPEMTDVQVVAFRPTNDVAAPIRTADATGIAPRLLRENTAPLVLPPAPVPCDFEAPVPVEAIKP